MAARDRSHILLNGAVAPEPYRRPRGGGGNDNPWPSPADRRAHAERLTADLETAMAEGLARREEVTALTAEADGVYITFESFPAVGLALQSLDPRQGRSHPELMSVQRVRSEAGIIERATVFVPDGTLGYFLGRLHDYAESAGQDKPKHRALVERINAVGLASIEALWTDPPDLFPEADTLSWWEVWLRRGDGQEVVRLREYADSGQLKVGSSALGFADRIVVLIRATANQLAEALDVLDDLAELRRPHEPAELLALEPAFDQAEWVRQLAERTEHASANAPAACILDTGIFRSHPLLKDSIAVEDCHAYTPSWHVDDHSGHGTEMAGLALYGDLGRAIGDPSSVRLKHRLESVKVLPPPPGANDPELYGAITATATSLVEIQAPQRRRIFALSITAQGYIPEEEDQVTQGQPTSWSAAIDALSAGESIDANPEGLTYLNEPGELAPRLFLVSAGNIRQGWEVGGHLERSDVEPVEDPGQAWNVVTVGAYTDLDSMEDAGSGYADWTPVAPRGELSPFSRTSVAFSRSWPIKPDIVLEGGNVARSPAGSDFDTPEVLQVLTTKAPLTDQRLLTVTAATSAATAQAAHIGAAIRVEYPGLWPETVRALLVHSAEWTPAMNAHFSRARTRARKDALHRRYGMGVPTLDRALRSATDALTLVAQETIHPFSRGRMRELHVHDLPWPRDVLTQLGSAPVRLRVTLSYFVTPSPSRRGWARRYSYASHGLRFDVRRPTETVDDFRKRLNESARLDGEERPDSQSDASEWLLGPDQRTAGSLHTDIWTGTAADLAERATVAVYPVSGWWKESAARDGSDRGARYALVVSIETPGQDVDIWTPVAQQVGLPIEIAT